MHDLVVAAHQFGINHRRAAATVTVSGIYIISRVIEELIATFYVCPAIGVQAQFLRDDARIFEVANAVVVGGQCHKGAVWLGDS